ncbi:MAG: hypothetical protein B7W97_02145, partial [Mycobacterium sp. 20-66-4]
RNMQLMDLRSPRIPKPEGLKVDKGELDTKGFEAFCEEWMFKSILASIDDWLEPFVAKIDA